MKKRETSRARGQTRIPEREKRIRPWRETTAGELKVWIGIVIKMGLYRELALARYWSKKGRNGRRKVSKKPIQKYRRLARPSVTILEIVAIFLMLFWVYYCLNCFT